MIENMRKVYAWGQEKLKFCEGKRFPVVETKLGKIGMLICYDVEYPEPSRIEALKGADIIVDCAVWSIPQNAGGMWIWPGTPCSICSYGGSPNPVEDNCCGSSMIVGTDGEIRAMASGRRRSCSSMRSIWMRSWRSVAGFLT